MAFIDDLAMELFTLALVGIVSVYMTALGALNPSTRVQIPVGAFFVDLCYVAHGPILCFYRRHEQCTGYRGLFAAGLRSH